MDNTIVINGHTFRLETCLSDSPWQDAGSRGSCYDQPGMPVPPVLDIHPYPAMVPEAPDDTPSAPVLDIHPYPTVVQKAPGDPPAAPVLNIRQYSAVAQEPPDDMADTAPDADGASPKQDDRTHPSPATTKKSGRQRAEAPQLDGKLRFESGRLCLAGGDSAGRPVYSVSGDHLAPAGNLDISKLQPFYDVAMEEITHMDEAPGAGHVYSVELARLLNLMEITEGELLLDKGEAIEHVLDAIDYGSGFAAPTSAPWKNCLRLLGRAGYDWEKDIVLFTAPLLSRLSATGLESAEAADVPAGDVRVIEAEADNAKGITRTKLRRLGLLDQFRFIQEDDEGSILFALPLPPPYADGLEYDLLEDGVQMTKKDFHHAEDAWQRYADSLPVCSKRTKGNAMDMQWDSDSNETNTVRFHSPYCNQIIRILLKKHLKRDKYGNIQMTPGGQPQLSPFNSFAVQLPLNTERNKLAAEIVRYVVYLVDASGRSNGTPHAKARTILNECPELKHRIVTAKSNSDRNKYLKRAFTRAWQILNDPECLDLLKQHKDFQVPTDIPTMKTLDSLVFRFSSKDVEPSTPKKRR